MKDYRPAKKRASVSVGESVRILRELQEMSQNQLAEAVKKLEEFIDRVESLVAQGKLNAVAGDFLIRGARTIIGRPWNRIG